MNETLQKCYKDTYRLKKSIEAESLFVDRLELCEEPPLGFSSNLGPDITISPYVLKIDWYTLRIVYGAGPEKLYRFESEDSYFIKYKFETMSTIPIGFAIREWVRLVQDGLQESENKIYHYQKKVFAK